MKQETMKSVKKTLDILNLFLNSQIEMTLGEITKLSGLSKSTAMRIVSVLVKYGYLRQKEKRGKYTLGTIYLYFNKILTSRIQIRNIAIPHLIKLGQRVDEVTVLALENGIEDLFTEAFRNNSRTNNLLLVVADQGTRTLPLHCTSLGKTILAYMSEKQLQLYFDSKVLERYTPNTITDPDEMRKQLATIRKKGIAYDDEEFSLGVRTVGTVIRDGEDKVVGSISVIAPSVRLTWTKIRKIVPDIKNCARDISRELGYND